MQKTRVEKEKQGKLLSVLAALDAQALQGVLLERAKQAALAMAVALLEQDAEVLCGPRYSRKTAPQCQRGGSERSTVVLEGARYGIWDPPPARTPGEPGGSLTNLGPAPSPGPVR